MNTTMGEPCGFCHKSYLPNRKINESLICACERPFFSQTVSRNNLPIDKDCWIEVPKRFVRHYSCFFGETANFEADNGRSYSCPLVGSDLAIVGYGFEWYNFASSLNIGMGDLVVFTLMEKSHFLVQLYRANSQTVPQAEAVQVKPDVRFQVAEPVDWVQTKARGSDTDVCGNHIPTSLDIVPFEAPKKSVQNNRLEDDSAASGEITSNGGEEQVRRTGHGLPSTSGPESRSEGKTNDRNISEEVSGGDDGKRSKCSPQLYFRPRRDSGNRWAEPGTTTLETYVSKRRSVTSDEKERALNAAKACSISHNSYLRQLEKDNCYRTLRLAIPVPWYRENMPVTKKSFMGTLLDEEGNTWPTRIRGTEVFWGNFTLDHYLEEDDVVVMELVDPRLQSLKFLVHIFRVLDVKVTQTGKAGWALHYKIVEGIKKEEDRKNPRKGKGRLK